MLGEKDFSSIEKSRIINLIPAESMCNTILNRIRARLKKIYADEVQGDVDQNYQNSH
jgi:hypothetical protein